MESGKRIGRIPWALATALLFSACGDGTATEDLAGRPEACGMYRCGTVDGVNCGNCEHLTGMFRSGDYACDPLGYCVHPDCGNRILEDNEQCEPGMSLACATLDTAYYFSGNAACSPTCSWDTSTCIERDVCGNAVLEEGELCEMNEEKSCIEIDAEKYIGGAARCDECQGWDVGLCMNQPVCGNDVLERDELCEPGMSFYCTLLDPPLYLAGQATCLDDCSGWDTDDCIFRNVCGNGSVENDEVCEITAHVPCIIIDSDRFVSGTARCLDDCLGWDISDCTDKDICGNGFVENNEVCDLTTGRSCTLIDSTLYKNGKAYCLPDCSGWDTTSCVKRSTCGDGIVETDEPCEIGDTKACIAINSSLYIGGTATCNATCTGWTVSSCVRRDVCGNGVQESGEECDTSDSIPCVEIDPVKYTAGTSYCNDDCTGWDISTCEE